MVDAYAVSITETNMGAIRSEKPGFDLDRTRAWLEENDAGFFIRHEDSPWDCEFLETEIFEEIYEFVELAVEEGEIFHRVRLRE